LKPLFIVAIVAVVMIGMMIPNISAQDFSDKTSSDSSKPLPFFLNIFQFFDSWFPENNSKSNLKSTDTSSKTTSADKAAAEYKAAYDAAYDAEYKAIRAADKAAAEKLEDKKAFVQFENTEKVKNFKELMEEKAKAAEKEYKAYNAAAEEYRTSAEYRTTAEYKAKVASTEAEYVECRESGTNYSKCQQIKLGGHVIIQPTESENRLAEHYAAQDKVAERAAEKEYKAAADKAAADWRASGLQTIPEIEAEYKAAADKAADKAAAMYGYDSVSDTNRWETVKVPLPETLTFEMMMERAEIERERIAEIEKAAAIERERISAEIERESSIPKHDSSTNHDPVKSKSLIPSTQDNRPYLAPPQYNPAKEAARDGYGQNWQPAYSAPYVPNPFVGER
jgi:hypothetical protein